MAGGVVGVCVCVCVLFGFVVSATDYEQTGPKGSAARRTMTKKLGGLEGKRCICAAFSFSS